MNILIADDDPCITKLYQLALESRGHTVTVANDGEECINVYNRESARFSPDVDCFDVVILDYHMPRVDGLEAAKKIIELRPDQRVVIVTAFLREALKACVKEIGQVVCILEKPFEPVILARVVEDVFAFNDLAALNKILKSMGKYAQSEEQVTELHSLLKVILKVGSH